MEYLQFMGLNFVVYLISLCRTDVSSVENLENDLFSESYQLT